MHATGPEVGHARFWAPLAAVWALTLVGVVIAVGMPAAARPHALALVLALAVVTGMFVQVAVGEQRGFVLRFAVGCCGSLLLVLAGTLPALLRG